MNRHGLFPDFSVARQSRIYGFAPSSRLELRKNSTSYTSVSQMRPRAAVREIAPLLPLPGLTHLAQINFIILNSSFSPPLSHLRSFAVQI